MSIRGNRYNDPALGQAFNNIASIFAPPSAQDMAGYATANAKKQEAERLAWLFENADDPLADRKATMAGVYNPTQSYYAQNQNNATTIRGQDVTANTTLQTNAADNTRALATNAADNQRAVDTNAADNSRSFAETMYGKPLAQGETTVPLPASVAEMYRVEPRGAIAGAPKPLSETEVKGQERLGLREAGLLTDDILLDGIFGERTPVKVQGEDGPVFSTPGAAARTGAPAFIDAGSQPKPENAMAVLPGGQQVPAVQDATGVWKHAQTGETLPANIQVYKTPAPTGSLEEVGVGKPVANNIDRQLIDVAVAKDTAVTLRDMIAASPASQGAVGWLRGTTQNVVQTGGELGTFFGGQMQEVSDAIASGAADANLAGAFDPSLPAIEMMANLLAFQYAKTTTGERLSNEMLRASRAALGLEGLTANQASSLARIDQAIAQMESQEAILRRIRTEGTGGGQPARAPGATQAVAPPETPAPEGIDPGEWEFMTPEERALFK